ncbi:ABC transporter permease [Novispirillum sp. DQ9]|uniref:ABC transporter permease n=1 Tax=Novispirillum sp. DQ9 TaxID=3398612 RepID=UPI003C7D004D
MSDLALAWRLARRELRGGLRGFRIFLACLALGVFAIVAAGSTNRAIHAGLERDGQALLGGDIELSTTADRPLSAELREYLGRHGTLADLRGLRAMAGAPTTPDRQLVEVKAVDGAYPLYGTVQLDPAQPLHPALERQGDGAWGAVVDPSMALRLGLAVGDRFTLGDADFVISALITREPDRVATAFTFGPRVMVSRAALEATGLIQPGSLVTTSAKLRIEDGTTAQALARAIERDRPGEGWRVRTTDSAAPGLERFLDQITQFLTLVGLTALLVGGIGVANAVRAFIDGRAETIAVLKCLGAPSRLVFQTYLVQIGALTGLGVAIGLVAGALMPFLAGSLLAQVLPVEARVALYPQPLLEGLAFGVLTALVFGLWPLARTRFVPAAGLFRGLLEPADVRWPGWSVALGVGGGVVALIALAIGTAPRPDLAAWFVLGGFGAYLLFRGAAALVMMGGRAANGDGRPALRLALTNLRRPGAPTPTVVLSLGLGLSVLVAVALVEGNLDRQVNERMPETAPAFFFIDIQPDQLDGFRRAIAGLPESRIVDQADMVRGRIVALNGTPVDESSVAPEAQWAVRGDRGLTTTRTARDLEHVVAGDWWPEDHAGEPLISLVEGVARGLGVGIGDTVTVNVLGREVTGRIANLREVDWSTLSMNFSFIFSGNALAGAPRTWIATVAVPPGGEARVERAVAEAAPNASAIRVREALESVNQIIAAAAQAVRAAAAITLVAGVLVLSGAIAAGRRRRVYEAVVLKVLGAVRADVLRAYLLEYGLMGAATGIIAAGVGTVAAWGTLVFVMRAQWVFLPQVVAATVVGCIALTLALGFLGTWRALGARASGFLRNE